VHRRIKPIRKTEGGGINRTGHVSRRAPLHEVFTRSSGGNAEVALNVRKDAVAQGTSLLDVSGTQREAKALSSGIRLVDSNVTPPYTAIVPQVVVEVIIVNTKRDLCLLRCHF